MIDASQWFAPLRRNLGKKNCELAEGDIRRILDLYLGEAQETDSSTDQSKWFDTQDFGYWKITVERPLRLKSQLKTSAIDTLRFASGDEELRTEIYAEHGDKLYTSFAKLKPEIEAWLKGGSEDDDDAEDGDEEGTHAKKAVPEKRRKRLLDATTWQRDKGLLDLALLAQKVLGDAVFDDHNVFRAEFDIAMKAHDKKLTAADKKPSSRR